MKRLLIALLAAVLASGVFAQDTAFPDIPANHWAADAVARIADLGIIIGFPDGTFRGNEAFTRYQASLVISRTLDVINANIEAMGAMAAEDIASLRAALQQLAGDVASQGVRLAATESAVASLADDVAGLNGDVAALGSDVAQLGSDVSALGSDVSALGSEVQSLGSRLSGVEDDVVANSARIDDLEAALDELAMSMPGDGGVDPAVLQELRDQIASLGVAVDTALAQSAAAADLANDAVDIANAAAARARENAAAIAALNAVVNLLSDDVTELQNQVRGLAVGEPIDIDLSGIDRNASDIANIREFVILLRRDQVAIRDRVAALEASDAEQAAAIADLQDRVGTLENNLFDVSGTIEFSYTVVRTSGPDWFDFDRAFGSGFDAAGPLSPFSEGGRDTDDDGVDDEDATEVADFTGNVVGDMDITLDVTFGFSNLFDGLGSPNGLNSFSGAIEVKIIEDESDDADGDNAGTNPALDFEIYIENLLLLAFIGEDTSLYFNVGEEAGLAHALYGADMTEYDGFNFGLAAPRGFLGAELNGFYVSNSDAAPGPTNTYVRGIEGRLSPVAGISGGVHAAQWSVNAEDHADVQGDNVNTLVWGLDGELSLLIFDLVFEYENASLSDDPGTAADDSASAAALYATLTVDGDALPLIDSLQASYFDIAGGWDALAHADEDNFPFAQDQAGALIEAGLGLFILDLDGYFTQYSTGAPTASVTAFGVDATANLFAGFSLEGFFHQASIDGSPVDDVETGIDGDEVDLIANPDGVERDENYDTGFGVGLVHDGDADNALIDRLNLEFRYEQTEADFSRQRILAAADYSLSLGFLTIDPYASFELINDSDPASDDTQTIKAGALVETDPLGIFLAPSIYGTVNYRNASHTDTGAADYTANELQFAVGLALNEFLFDHSVLKVRYASYTGTNVDASTGPTDPVINVSEDTDTGDATTSVSGYEVIWNYWDLEFVYGVFTFTAPGTAGTAAQYFTISYTVEF